MQKICEGLRQSARSEIEWRIQKSKEETRRLEMFLQFFDSLGLWDDMPKEVEELLWDLFSRSRWA